MTICLGKDDYTQWHARGEPVVGLRRMIADIPLRPERKKKLMYLLECHAKPHFQDRKVTISCTV